MPLRGERLAILTNGGGPAIMAVDALSDRGGKLARLSQETINRLSAVLPSCWSHANPIDIIGDADIHRYQQAVKILLDSDDFDGLLIMHSPSAIAPDIETANALIETLHQHPRTKRFNIRLTGLARTKQILLVKPLLKQAIPHIAPQRVLFPPSCIWSSTVATRNT